MTTFPVAPAPTAQDTARYLRELAGRAARRPAHLCATDLEMLTRAAGLIELAYAPMVSVMVEGPA